MSKQSRSIKTSRGKYLVSKQWEVILSLVHTDYWSADWKKFWLIKLGFEKCVLTTSKTTVEEWKQPSLEALSVRCPTGWFEGGCGKYIIATRYCITDKVHRAFINKQFLLCIWFEIKLKHHVMKNLILQLSWLFRIAFSLKHSDNDFKVVVLCSLHD